MKTFKKFLDEGNEYLSELKLPLRRGVSNDLNVRLALKLAQKYAGNMTKAVTAIEKLRRGLSQDPEVADALRQYNESVNEARLNILDIMPPLEDAANNLDKYTSNPVRMIKDVNTIIKLSRDLMRFKDRDTKQTGKELLDGASELLSLIQDFKKKKGWEEDDEEEFHSLLEWLIEEIFTAINNFEEWADAGVYESMAEGKKDYKIYHRLYSDAVEEAINLAFRQGYDVSSDDIFQTISTGPRKPSEGKTNSFKLPLTFNGKPVRKMLVFQVYGMKNQYELTAYVS